MRQVLSCWVELFRPSLCISDMLVRPTPAYDTWLALRQIQQSLPSSGSVCCISWWLLFARAIILMRGVSGYNGGQLVPTKEGGRICPCSQGSRKLALLTGREWFVSSISSLKVFKTTRLSQLRLRNHASPKTLAPHCWDLSIVNWKRSPFSSLCFLAHSSVL
jgi:hypothetical protein